jgi:D-alanyl-D-alanine carboxypeptidase/D-alanyl-D-alanine-endopeptidase (penicillin-binding protein 4)
LIEKSMQALPSLKLSLRNSRALIWPVAATLLVIWVLMLRMATASAAADGFESIKSLIGPHDALIVSDSKGRTIISKNKNKKLVPASILKLLTSLVALHYLGPDYRYATEFYLDRHSNLIIKGFGDPLLISEIINDIAARLSESIGGSAVINDLVVDDSYFNQPLTIPGISSSSQPFDAPNGALCVNFNTVFFKRRQSGYISAEAQTPLLPYAEKKIRARNLKNGRFILSHLENENAIYAGKLFQYFLKQHGVEFSGTVTPGRVNETEDKIIYRYSSRFSLTQIISKLLEHSNNFTTNQLFITSGLEALGPPGNLGKGVAAALDYTSNVLDIKNLSIVEGSGISRRNRISAHQMLRVLDEFEPHHRLMRKKGREFYKTGTLYGVNTRAGYIADGNGGLYRYVVMINTPGKSTKPIMRKLLRILKLSFGMKIED